MRKPLASDKPLHMLHELTKRRLKRRPVVEEIHDHPSREKTSPGAAVEAAVKGEASAEQVKSSSFSSHHSTSRRAEEVEVPQILSAES